MWAGHFASGSGEVHLHILPHPVQIHQEQELQTHETEPISSAVWFEDQGSDNTELSKDYGTKEGLGELQVLVIGEDGVKGEEGAKITDQEIKSELVWLDNNPVEEEPTEGLVTLPTVLLEAWPRKHRHTRRKGGTRSSVFYSKPL